MVEIHAFVNSLKITWLRRIILNSETDNWRMLSGIDFSKIVSLGDCHFKSISKKLSNPFWKDLTYSLYLFCIAVKPQGIEDILCSPIWCNSNFSLNNETFIFKDWFDKGIRNIFDIVDINGHLYNFESYKEHTV